ncbi:MAG TPA: tripartite tricarboxylate transporter substrate binding protein [Trueperaceae bacterium]
MKRLLLSITALLLTTVMAVAMAQGEYPWQPTQPITIIVPWAAGGSTDQMTRIVAGEIEDELGVSVVVVNQPGASGSIGTANALNAPKDGYTWAAGAIRDVGTYPVLGMLDTSAADWHLYFAVANTGVVGANPRTPYEDFGDLLEAMRENPGEISVATAGLSSAGHTVMEQIAQAADLEYRHVPYDGGNPAVIATVAGETDITTQLAVEQAEMIRGKRIRPLAAYSDQPLVIEGYGEIPPITNWLPDMQIPMNYFGIWAPKGIPDEVVETMNMVWENRIQDSEALRNYAQSRGALFTPIYGEEAYQDSLSSIAHQAWTLYDGGKAVIEPSEVGIPRPE